MVNSCIPRLLPFNHTSYYISLALALSKPNMPFPDIHCSQLHSEIRRLSEAPLAESALRDLLSSGDREWSSSVTPSGRRKWPLWLWSQGETHPYRLTTPIIQSSRLMFVSMKVVTTQLLHLQDQASTVVKFPYYATFMVVFSWIWHSSTHRWVTLSINIVHKKYFK